MTKTIRLSDGRGPHLRLGLAVVLGFVLPLAAVAQLPEEPASRSMSIKECVAYALENAQAVKETRFDIMKSRQDVREILGIGYPQISGQAGATYNYEVPTQVVPADAFTPPGAPPPEEEFLEFQFGTDWQLNVGVELRQLLVDGTYFLGLKSTKEVVDLMQKTHERSQIETAAEVEKAYYSVLVARQRLRMLQTNIQRLDSLQSETKAYFEEGFVEEIDLMRIKVNLNNLRTELQNAKAMTALTMEVLKFQMGMPMETNLTLTDTLDVDNVSKRSFSSEGSVRPEQRIEYRILSQQLKLQGINETRYRMEYLPKLSGFMNYRYQKFDSDLSNLSRFWFPAGAVGLQLQVPIFNGFQTDARVQRTRINQARIATQRENFVRSMTLEASRAKVEMDNAIRTLRMQEENLKLSEEVYRVAKVKYEEGLGSNMEVIEAESDLQEAQTSYTDAVLQAYIKQVELQRALGTLELPLEPTPSTIPARPADSEIPAVTPESAND